MAFETVLRGGRVVDGSGAEPVRADVGIEGDRVTAIGDLDGLPAGAELDVTGLLVFPGFIDAHVHVDALLATPRVQQAMLRQGVTTAIIGQDGVSFAPTDAEGARYSSRYFAAVNGVVPDAFRSGSDVTGLLAGLVAGSGVNAGYLVPAGTVRAQVLGSADRPAEPHEIARMTELVEQAVAQGALGLSTGLDYVPGGFADAAELAALAAPVGAAGGAVVSHLRGYATEHIHDSILELARIAAASGARGHVSHLHGRADLVTAALDDAAARHGAPLSFDSYPYLRGATILAMIALPKQLQAGGIDATLARLRDPAVRARLRRDWFPANGRLGSVTLSFVAAPDFAWAEGLSLLDAVERYAGDLADFVCDVLIASDLAVGCVVDNGADRRESDLRELLRRREQMASSDAIYVGSRPHPRGWGAFARLLARHVRELGDWSWGEAGYHLAGHAAERFGLTGRGRVAVGGVADLAVVDPERVADRADYDAPMQPAVGIPHVLVAGVPVVRDGEPTGATPGRALTLASDAGTRR